LLFKAGFPQAKVPQSGHIVKHENGHIENDVDKAQVMKECFVTQSKK
jgi:hypothetical protein